MDYRGRFWLKLSFENTLIFYERNRLCKWRVKNWKANFGRRKCWKKNCFSKFSFLFRVWPSFLNNWIDFQLITERNFSSNYHYFRWENQRWFEIIIEIIPKIVISTHFLGLNSEPSTFPHPLDSILNSYQYLSYGYFCGFIFFPYTHLVICTWMVNILTTMSATMTHAAI